jgi:Domain of unknown function (DUF4389)
VTEPHPVRLVVTDDLRRSRLTVFFRLLLTIPHLIWAGLIGIAVFVCVIANWFILLVTAQTPKGLHDFVAGYIRYTTHLEAYLLLAANPFPGFYPATSNDSYPVTVEIDPPAPQNRLKTLFRLFLAIPAILISAELLWGPSRGGGYGGAGLAFVVAFLLWWVALFRGWVPRGMRDLVAYTLGYSAQLFAYLFLLTDRYPYSGPNAFVEARDEETPHPVRVTVNDDLRRSRLLVLFRLPVAIPHIVWFVLWTLVAWLVGIVNWVCTLVIGRSPDPFHRFLSRYVRYGTHLGAFILLIGNPFPGFAGAPGSYPVDLELPQPESQHRLKTLFRLVLALPAFIVSSGLNGALFLAGVLGWFVGLFLARMPDGLRNLGAYALRYGGQLNAYVFLLTERYPDAGPRPDPASP